jgi:hypothetical protein
MVILFGVVPIYYFSGAVVLAQRIECADQLEIIGDMISKYQDNHKGKNPPDLETLVTLGYLDSKMLICPADDEEGIQNSYVYRGEDLTIDTQDDLILIYDKHGNHGSKMNFLLSDLDIRYFPAESLTEIIKEDNKLRRKLGLPEKPADKEIQQK